MELGRAWAVGAQGCSGPPPKHQDSPWPCPHSTVISGAPHEVRVPQDITHTRGTEAACSPGEHRVVGSVSEPVQNTFFLAFPFLKPLH